MNADIPPSPAPPGLLPENRATDRLCDRKRLTPSGQYGLMRPVARIAQSVEQGIENPRVLGSIPSPGTIFRITRLWRVFRFLGYGLSIELRSIIRSYGLTLRASAKALFNAAPAPVVRVRASYSYQRTSTEVRFCIISPHKITHLESFHSTQIYSTLPTSSPLRM